MGLVHKYIYEFNNEYLKYLYKHDTEILITTNVRGCLLLRVDENKYAVPFRSNMKHQNGILIPIGNRNYGLDFSKAIPVVDNNLLVNVDFQLSKKEEEYYAEVDNFILLCFKFEQYLKHIYYENKEHNTHHKILKYAQKLKYILSMDNIKIYNEMQEEVKYLKNMLNYETLYDTLDCIYDQKIDDIQIIKNLLEKNNSNIFVYIN